MQHSVNGDFSFFELNETVLLRTTMIQDIAKAIK